MTRAGEVINKSDDMKRESDWAGDLGDHWIILDCLVITRKGSDLLLVSRRRRKER